jgi:hypothetical protein
MKLDLKLNEKLLYKNLLEINKNLFAYHSTILEVGEGDENLTMFLESFEDIINEYK